MTVTTNREVEDGQLLFELDGAALVRSLVAQRESGDAHKALAHAIRSSSARRLRNAVAGASPADETGVELIAQWLARTAEAFVLLGCRDLDDRQVLIVAIVPGALSSADGLILDGRASDLDLPLLEYAADLAATMPSGRLVVAVADLLDSNGVACRGDQAVPASIVLARSLVEDTPDRVRRVWAHELAHLSDAALNEIATELEEVFADEFGGWLDEHEPTSIGEARKAIEHYDRCRRQIMRSTERRYALPEPGLDSLLAFAFLPLGERPMESRR